MKTNTNVVASARQMATNSISNEIITTLRSEVEMLMKRPDVELSPARIAEIESNLRLIECNLLTNNPIVIEDYEVHPNGLIHECGGDVATITDIAHAILHLAGCYD